MQTVRELYLLRHAEAEDVGVRGVTRDADRMLTDHGVRQARAVGQCLCRTGVHPERVCASPFVRAQETARIVLEELGRPGQGVSADEALTPSATPERLWQVVMAQGGRGAVLLVGHLPSIAVFAGWLLEGAGDRLHFHKASLARIDVTCHACRPQARLEWLLPAAVAGRWPAP
jgi:phosphohistidine phosphatase